MNQQLLEQTIKDSFNLSEVSKKLYGNINCGNRNTIRKYIGVWNIDISHFVTDARSKTVPATKIPLDQILVVNSTYDTGNLKSRLYKEGLKKPICELCGQTELWNGNIMSLILDHINGIHSDARLENLRIVCPNCNATLPTHGGKNAKYIPKPRKPYIKKSRVRDYDKTRKVIRPDYDTLCKDIIDLGYAGTGRKYGVCDNSVRKWKKYYEKFNNLKT